MNQKNMTFDEIYRRIDVTTRVRYNAANRFKTHQWLSQWIVTLLSVGLIVIPLLKALNVPLRTSPQLLDAVEVFLAVLVLAYSLLLGNENYAGRAEKMLACGMELSRLARELYPLQGKEYDEAKYLSFSERYHDILERYDNHNDIDYKIYTLNNRQKYYPNIINFSRAWILIQIQYCLNFSHYALVTIGVLTSVAYAFLFVK